MSDVHRDPLEPPAAPPQPGPDAPPPPPQVAPPPPPEVAPPPPVVWEPVGGGPSDPTWSSVRPVALWSSGTVGGLSFLFGFPAGLGLTAQNLWRLGRRGFAAFHLLLAPVALLGLFLLAGVTRLDARLVGGVVNLAFVAYVARRASRDTAAAARHGRPVVPPRKLPGAGAIVGGWALAYVAIVPLIALIFIGGQVSAILAGTVETGTTGADCSVTGARTTFEPGATVYIVAHFRHAVRTGQTAHLLITPPVGTPTSMDAPVTSGVSCANAQYETTADAAGVYRVDLSVDGEPLATGSFTVVGTAVVSPSVRPSSAATPAPTLASPTATVSAATPSPSPVDMSAPRHDAPDLEALLPKSVSGQKMTSESYRGRTLFAGLYGAADSDIAQLEASLDGTGHTIDDIALASAGRVLPGDRPYFVEAFEFKGVAAGDLEKVLGVPATAIMVDHSDDAAFTPVVIGGKHVLKGTLAMIDQTDHARGLPYVYLWRDVTFEVVTDNPAWAAAALKALP